MKSVLVLSAVCFLSFLWIVASVHAVSLAAGTVINNTAKSFSFNITVDSTVDQVTTDSSGVWIYNASLLGIKNVNASGNGIVQYSGTQALIYNPLNGTPVCATLSSCTGNVNISLPAGNSSYVLDNYNVTEGVTRSFDPIRMTVSETFTARTYNIASNVTGSLRNVPFYLNVDCSRVGKNVTVIPKNGASYVPSFTCDSATNRLFIANVSLNYSTSSNQIVVPLNQALQNSCSDTIQNFTGVIVIVGLILTIVFIGAVIVILLSSFNMVPEIEVGGVELKDVMWGVSAVAILGILIIAIIYIFESGICPAFGG